MNTFTAQELADFYQKVADGGEIGFRHTTLGEFNPALVGPCLHSNSQDWYIKPAKKSIDLSVLIDSQIDCTHDLTDGYGPLDDTWTEEALCEARVVPRTKYKHAWQGGECPLPEGFRVKVWYRNAGKTEIFTESTKADWLHKDFPNLALSYNIIAFEVLRVADGYVMPWESE